MGLKLNRQGWQAFKYFILPATAAYLFLNQDFNHEQQIRVKQAELDSLKRNRDSLEMVIETERNAAIELYAPIAAFDNSLDYSKHPYYNRIKKFEASLDSAIAEASRIFPISKLQMIEQLGKESGYGTLLVSPAGAAGPWMFMPETGEKLGLKVYYDSTGNYYNAAKFRQLRRGTQRKIDMLAAEMGEIEQNYHKKGKNNAKQFAKWLSGMDANAGERYSVLADRIEALKKEKEQYSWREKSFLGRYTSELKKIAKMPYEKRILLDERFDTDKSTNAAVRLMADFLLASHGNLTLALSMYNADSESLDIKPYNETQNYIKAINNNYVMYRSQLRPKNNLGLFYRDSNLPKPLKHDLPTIRNDTSGAR